MATSKHSDETILNTYYSAGSKRAAAEELGMARSTIQHHLRRILGSEPPNDTSKTIVVKPRYRVQGRGLAPTDTQRVLAIGDCHDSPTLSDKSRFEAFGRIAREYNVNSIVQIGDFSSLDSMSTHEPNETVKGQQKPSFRDDMISLRGRCRPLIEGWTDTIAPNI